MGQSVFIPQPHDVVVIGSESTTNHRRNRSKVDPDKSSFQSTEVASSSYMSPIRGGITPTRRAFVTKIKNYKTIRTTEFDTERTRNKLPQINGDDVISEEKEGVVPNGRSNSCEEKDHVAPASIKNTIETIYKNLHLALIYKSSSNASNVAQDLSRILSCLKNWELFSEKIVKLACKALGLIAQSASNFLLVEQENIRELSAILAS
jgi:hypothetical protein